MIADVTDATLKHHVPDNGPVILVFHQEGCPGCTRIRPEIERLAALYPDVPVLRALIRENQLSQLRWDVKAAPSIYAIMRDAGRSVAYADVNPTMLNLAFTMAAGGS